jgi:hypothetical protein
MNSLFATIRKNWHASIRGSKNTNTISSSAYTFLVCIILFLFIILLWGIAKMILVDKDIRELWSDFGAYLYLAHPGRIFSAEYDVPPHERILQQPTKCFSCERDMIRRGINPAYGNKTKCFSCESEIASCSVYS